MSVEDIMPIFKRLGIDVRKCKSGIEIQSEEGIIFLNDNYKIKLKKGESLWEQQ